jgi:hypothetical protein
MADRRGAYGVLVGRPDGKRPHGKPKRRWEDNIKMYLQVVGWGGMEWIGLVLDRDRCHPLVSGVMKLRVP